MIYAVSSKRKTRRLVIMKNVTWLNVLLGICLIIAPFALCTVGPNGTWTANDIVLGVLLIAASIAIISAAAPAGTLWFEMLCGVWLIVAPFVLKYSNGPVKMRNDIVSGIIAIVVAAIALSAFTTPRP